MGSRAPASWDDLPAVVYWDCAADWRFDGHLHRDGGKPAMVGPGCELQWWIYGRRHRDRDLPAVIRTGVREWWTDNLLHRDRDKPTRIFATGEREWWVPRRARPRRAGRIADVAAPTISIPLAMASGSLHPRGPSRA